MKKFEGKLILSDMDGTILDKNKEISQQNKDAIAYFVEHGGKFSLATGRPRRSMEYYVSQVAINAPVVIYNGSGVYDFQNHKTISQTYMKPEAVAFVRHLIDKFPYLSAEVYLTDREFVAQPNDISRRHFVGVGLELLSMEPEQMPQPWVKVNFVAPQELVIEVEDYAQAQFAKEYFFQRSGNNFFEAMSHGVDKGTGALEVCKYMGIAPKNLYVIGDHLNDIELLQAAGMAFAPANAVDAIKQMAHVIVADNNSSAIADMIGYLDQHL